MGSSEEGLCLVKESGCAKAWRPLRERSDGNHTKFRLAGALRVSKTVGAEASKLQG